MGIYKIILVLLLLSSPCFATITYEKISQNPHSRGIDVSVLFTDDETGEQVNTIFRFDSQTQIDSEYTARMNQKIINLEFNLNPLNELNIDGIRIGKVITKIVQYVRANPNCTVAQIKTAIDTQYPNLNWKSDNLITYIKDYLTEYLGRAFTFAQFKEYVINHKFYEVDE